MTHVLPFPRLRRQDGMAELTARQQNLVMLANLKDEDVPVPQWYPKSEEEEDPWFPFFVLCAISLYGLSFLAAYLHYKGYW